MGKETYRQVEEFAELYEGSNLGNVRRAHSIKMGLRAKKYKTKEVDCE